MTTIVDNTTITPDDLLRMDDAASYELVDGQLVERNVSRESSRIGAAVVGLFQTHVRQSHEAEIYGSDLGYRCFPDDPDRVRRPDASVVRRDRLHGISADAGYMPTRLISPSRSFPQTTWPTTSPQRSSSTSAPASPRSGSCIPIHAP